MIVPTQRSLLLLAAGFPVALLPVLISARLWGVWLAFLAGSLLLIGADAVLSMPRRRLRLEATPPAVLYIGSPDSLKVRLSAPRFGRAVTVELLPELGDNLSPQPPLLAEISGGEAEVEVPLVATRRGMAVVDAVWLRWAGPLGLTSRGGREALDASIGVVPNIRAVRSEVLQFFSNRELMTGLKMQHYIGDGSEFESLREYHPGLDHRAIDWKASARHKKLLVREFRAERNHQVYLAFDTGYLMGEPMDGIPRLDHAINAGLLLGFVCVKTGDRVGLFGFDDQVRLFREAQAGVQAVRRLQLQTAELDYGAAETNFTVGLTDLLTRLRRRSLVVVFTEFVDTVTAELMIENLNRLARRHLVIFVTFRDRTVHRLIGSAPSRLIDVNRAVVAADFARERELVRRRLQRLGIFCIEAPTSEVSVELINRYLEIKRRELV